MLKLVYVNPHPVSASDSQEIADGPNSITGTPPQKLSFREEIVASMLPHFGANTHLIGLCSYTMVAHDVSHYLSCSLTLEVQPSDDESELGNVICHFPVIHEEYLEALLWEDQVLINMVMMQFYLKILERLLVFCNNHNALKLIVYANAREARKMGIYEQFATHTEEIISHHGRTTTLVIPTDTETQHELIEYMAHVADAFRETLEDDDPVVQQYAKLSAFRVS